MMEKGEWCSEIQDSQWQISPQEAENPRIPANILNRDRHVVGFRCGAHAVPPAKTR